jgi:ATP-dependent DNA ligase
LYDRAVSTTDQPARVIDASAAAATWRPQQFSEGRSAAIEDPIIEPLWSGLRVLALVDDGRVTIRDLDGDPIDEFEGVAAELAEASRATKLLVDGYLTHQPIQGIAAVAYREMNEKVDEAPSITQHWFGSLARLRSRKKPPPVETMGRDPLPADEDVAIVVVDLLWLDDEPMLAIPLLERKRILESVLGESKLVRRGTFVRPPIDTWVGSWRAFGFSRLAYKGANSRYTPGATNSQWAVAELPTR